VTGVLIAAASTGDLDADVGMVLAAHLNAILGCFWLLGVAFTLPMVTLGETGRRWLCASALVAAFANWGVTLVKALLKVHGIAFVGEPSNDVIYVLLAVTVVVPTFVSGALWVRGLWREPGSPA
jgi:hydroxylaminobenzene mutase